MLPCVVNEVLRPLIKIWAQVFLSYSSFDPHSSPVAYDHMVCFLPCTLNGDLFDGHRLWDKKPCKSRYCDGAKQL